MRKFVSLCLVGMVFIAGHTQVRTSRKFKRVEKSSSCKKRRSKPRRVVSNFINDACNSEFDRGLSHPSRRTVACRSGGAWSVLGDGSKAFISEPIFSHNDSDPGKDFYLAGKKG